MVEVLPESMDALLLAVASGDEDAFQTLSEQYSPLIRSMSEGFARSLSETADVAAIGVQDLEQEARLALYRAARSFDTKKDGITFGLYAKICIRNSLVSLWRKSVSAARAARKHSAAHSDGARDPFSEIVSLAETDALTARIRSVLSPYENCIFEQYISGRSVKCISESIGKPEKSVSNALYRIRVKIKGLLAN